MEQYWERKGIISFFKIMVQKKRAEKKTTFEEEEGTIASALRLNLPAALLVRPQILSLHHTQTLTNTLFLSSFATTN